MCTVEKLSISVLFYGFALGLYSQNKPNIIIYIADDHGCKQSEAYGDMFVKTPNMRRIAEEGIAFDNAFVASPASGPSRAALLSGLMPSRNGAEVNHTLPDTSTQKLVKMMQEQGYEVAAIGKIAHKKKHADMNGFDYCDMPLENLRDRIKTRVKKYLDSRNSDKPLCLLVGDRRPHVTWIKNSLYSISDITLPDYLIDTPETREHWGRYLTDIEGLDRSIGEIDSIAADYFGNKDYIFMYTADHGAQWPFGKWNLYDKGIKTSLLVRWPEVIKPKTRTDAMVSWIDIFPTLIDIAGGNVPKDIDGFSFKNVLTGEDNIHREYIYTTHTGDGDMNIYPIRSVRSGRYKYIRNLLPDCYHSNHSDILRKDGAGAYWDSWDNVAERDKNAAAIIEKYYKRSAVEFYDLLKDPDEQNNLAENPEYSGLVKEYSDMLDEWMKKCNDNGKAERKPYPLNGPTPHELVTAQKNDLKFKR